MNSRNSPSGVVKLVFCIYMALSLEFRRHKQHTNVLVKSWGYLNGRLSVIIHDCENNSRGESRRLRRHVG